MRKLQNPASPTFHNPPRTGKIFGGHWQNRKSWSKSPPLMEEGVLPSANINLHVSGSLAIWRVSSLLNRPRQQLKALIAHLSARVWDTHMAWLLFLYYFCTLGCSELTGTRTFQVCCTDNDNSTSFSVSIFSLINKSIFFLLLPPPHHDMNGYFQQIRWRMKDTKDMGKYSYIKEKKEKIR